jgi:hypothetical protein
MNVPHEARQVLGRIYKQRAVCSAEEVAVLRPLVLNPLSVWTRDTLDDPAERNLRNLYRQMDLACEPAECMHSHSVPLDRKRHESFQFVAILLVRDDALTRASMQSDVIETARAMESRRAHPWIQVQIPPVRTTT